MYLQTFKFSTYSRCLYSVTLQLHFTIWAFAQEPNSNNLEEVGDLWLWGYYLQTLLNRFLPNLQYSWILLKGRFQILRVSALPHCVQGLGVDNILRLAEKTQSRSIRTWIKLQQLLLQVIQLLLVIIWLESGFGLNTNSFFFICR